jgi:hypothetical protein
VSVPKQERFFDAVRDDPKMNRLQKIRWLHAAAVDYWERLEAVIPVLEDVGAHLDPVGLPRDDSGLHELHERVVAALRLARLELGVDWARKGRQ